MSITRNASSTAMPIPAFAQPHRRSPDFSAFSVVEYDDLMGFLRRLNTAGGYDPRTVALTFTPSESSRLEYLVRLVRWRHATPVEPASELMGLPLDPSVLARSSPLLGALEERAMAIGQRLGVTIGDFSDVDPFDPQQRILAVNIALTRIDNTLVQRQRKTGVTA